MFPELCQTTDFDLWGYWRTAHWFQEMTLPISDKAPISWDSTRSWHMDPLLLCEDLKGLVVKAVFRIRNGRVIPKGGGGGGGFKFMKFSVHQRWAITGHRRVSAGVCSDRLLSPRPCTNISYQRKCQYFTFICLMFCWPDPPTYLSWFPSCFLLSWIVSLLKRTRDWPPLSSEVTNISKHFPKRNCLRLTNWNNNYVVFDLCNRVICGSE